MFWLMRNRRSHMQRRYITVDVFTDRAFGGNPLAVILDAGGLSTAQMQAIASEFNYSETTFVLAPQDAEPPARLVFEEKAGLVPVEILIEDGKVVGAELTAPQGLKKLTQLTAEHAAACASLSAADVRTDRHPPQIVSVGLPFLVAELASRDALRRARPDADAFARTLPCDGSDAVYLYTRDVPTAEACDLQARMFHPGSSGLSEDPATGSATAAAAALLADLSGEWDGELKLRIRQGVYINRPSLLLTRVRKANGVVISAHVGGAFV